MAVATGVGVAGLLPLPSMAAKPDRIITGIGGWTHPTKVVFAGTRLRLERVELHRQSLYPVFFVSGPPIGTVVNAAFTTRLSAANGWWSSEIRHVTDTGLDTIRSGGTSDGAIDVDEIAVITTKRSRRTAGLTLLLSADRAVDAVARSAKVGATRPVVVGGEEVSMSLMIESPPVVPYATPGYWSVSVGENHPDHRVTLRRFDVNASTGAVWEVDPVEGTRTKLLKP